MSQGNRQFALTYDQRLLLDMYINFYNHTTRQMDSLYDLQSEIIEHINEISGLSSRERTRFTYNETPYNTRFNTNHHQNQNQNQNQNQHQNQHQPRNNNQNTYNNRRNNQNRNERVRQAAQTQLSPSNSRVVYIEGVPYLLDLTNFMRIRNSNNGNTDAANLWRSFNDNITVAPTRTQVDNSTRILHFSEIPTPINSSCPISLERFDESTSVMQILHCGHIFTPSGIQSWFQSNVRCPVCRYDIRDYRAQSNTSATTTREERHRVTEPGIETAEETKEEEPIAAADTPFPSIRNENERISNSIRQNTNINQNNRRITSENVTNVLSNITEEILNNILQPNGSTRSLFDPSQNSLFYDSSNNQFIFESFIRR